MLTAQNVEFSMQKITFALGVGCIYCHDLSNLALDTNPKKVKARMMLEMVRDINAKFGDGKTHVTCWTCHHASTDAADRQTILQLGFQLLWIESTVDKRPDC